MLADRLLSKAIETAGIREVLRTSLPQLFLYYLGGDLRLSVRFFRSVGLASTDATFVVELWECR